MKDERCCCNAVMISSCDSRFPAITTIPLITSFGVDGIPYFNIAWISLTTTTFPCTPHDLMASKTFPRNDLLTFLPVFKITSIFIWLSPLKMNSFYLGRMINLHGCAFYVEQPLFFLATFSESLAVQE